MGARRQGGFTGAGYWSVVALYVVVLLSTQSVMGLGIDKFVIGSNRNDILSRFFATGAMETADVVPTLSPSMDIQISSNFERLLFDYYGRDGSRMATVMEAFRKTGRVSFGSGRWRRMRSLFSGHRLDDDETRAAIRRVFETTGEILDPHSIIGWMAGEALPAPRGTAMVAVATAHPAKFPDAVEEAIGFRPPLPPRLADLLERPERLEVLPGDVGTVKDFIAQSLAGTAG